MNNNDHFVIHILTATLKFIGFIAISHHRIADGEYSSNIKIVRELDGATHFKSIQDAWAVAEFVLLHLFENHDYTFRVSDIDERDYTTFIPVETGRQV